MPLSNTRLKANILAILDDYDAITPEQKAAARDDFATKLANVIVDEVRQLQITYTTGLLAGQVPVTGVFNATLT